MVFEAWVLGVAVATGALAGTMIGAIGVGGIVVVPILVQLPGITIKVAIAAAMFSYIFAGTVGLLTYACKNSISWKPTIWMLVASAPSSFAATIILEYVNEFILKTCLYALMLGSSCLALYRIRKKSLAAKAADIESAKPAEFDPVLPPEPEVASTSTTAAEPEAAVPAANEPDEDTWVMRNKTLLRIIVGAVTGFGSSFTGTSGPVVGMPMLFLLDWPVLEALGSVQAMQLPIALCATLAYAWLRPGVLDLLLACMISLGLTPGVALGAHIAHKVPADTLQLAVAIVLVLSSIILVVKIVAEEI